MKRSPLKRLTPLKRRARPRYRQYRGPDHASSMFHHAVCERDTARGCTCWGCLVEPTRVARDTCRSQSIRYEAHHLIPQRVLRAEFPHGVFLGERDGQPGWLAVPYPGAVHGVPVRSLEQLLDDPRNGVLVGRWHHDRIENRRVTPLRAHLPAEVWAFAAELGVEWMLERWYPAVPTSMRRAA